MGGRDVNGSYLTIAQSGIEQPADRLADGLTLSGAAMMALSILMVLGLCVFCLVRVLREDRPGKKDHAPLDIDTHDRND